MTRQNVSNNSSEKFIVDHNVGKLAKWLRMLGFDTVFFTGDDDSQMVARALAENRVLLTRDTQIAERRVAASGGVKVMLFKTEDPEVQIRQVIESLNLSSKVKPFTICLECNQPLVERTREQVKDRVPPYVFKTQELYVECPACHRIYWKGTHWQAMTKKLTDLRKR